jgi:hypothetical protein
MPQNLSDVSIGGQQDLCPKMAEITEFSDF